jgi:outer membrane protein assembly factor BamB
MANFKQCPECGQHHPPTTSFCVNCGTSLDSVAIQAMYGGSQQFWEIPDYLQEASRWQRERDMGAAGSGLAWIGGILAAVPFLTEPDRPLAMASFGAGLLIIIAGLVRMRSSARTLARAGLIANAAALIVLGLVAGRMIFAPAQSETSSVIQNETIGDNPELTSESASLTVAGETLMFRGNPEHTGELGGPAPTGQPTLAWRFDASGEITSSAAVSNGVIYFTGRRGDIYAVDAQSGDIRWQAHLGDYILRSSPAISGNTVFVTGGYALFALNATTGEELWKLPIQYAAQSSPTIAGSLVFVASQDGRLYAVDAASGAQEWSYNAEGIIFGAPAISGGIAYIGTDAGMLHAISIERGNFIWKDGIGGNLVASPAVANGLVIVSSRGQGVIALDARNGEEQWRYSVSGRSSVAISQGIVLAGSDDGGVHAISLETGEPLWLFPTGSEVLSSPVVVGSVAYVASGLNLYAIDLTTGAGIWRFSTTDVIESSPAIANEQIYLGSRDGFLYAIGGSGTED